VGVTVQKIWLGAALIAACAGTAEAAAQSVTLNGRVRDASSGATIFGVAVTLDGSRNTVTGQEGQFQFLDVSEGPHNLRLRGLGYAETSLDVVLTGDTTLVISLDINPVLLDSLRANARNVTIRGRLIDGETGAVVPGGSVFASDGRGTQANLVGRFSFNKVPSGVPFEIAVFAFPYSAKEMVIAAHRDTTVELFLFPDTMMARVLAEQIERLDARARTTAREFVTVTHDELIRYGSVRLDQALFMALSRKAPYEFSGKNGCIISDERRVGRLALEDPVLNDPLSAFVPERIERVEVYHGMTRVYTRAFMQDMATGLEKLDVPASAEAPAGFRGRVEGLPFVCR
jgi:hypothetical protein